MRTLLLVLLAAWASATGHAAEAAAAHGESASGITKIMHDFGISLPFILAQIVNFSIVAFILWRFAFKPVLATLDARQRKIAEGLAYADEMKAKLEATQQQSAFVRALTLTNDVGVLAEGLASVRQRKKRAAIISRQIREFGPPASERSQRMGISGQAAFPYCACTERRRKGARIRRP